MSTFRQSTRTELEGMRRLTGWLQSISSPTKLMPLGYRFTNHMRDAKEWQQVWGDVAYFCRRDQRVKTLELKIEERFTGNAFLEAFSNLPATRQDFLQRGINCGWLFKNPAEQTGFQFLDNDSFFLLDTFNLKSWALDTQTSHRPDTRPRLYDFKFTEQRKCEQKNHTWGHVVPLAILEKEVGFLFACRNDLQFDYPAIREAAE